MSCRSVAKKQFEIAEVLTKAGADPWFVCSPVEGGQMTAVQALLDVIVPGNTHVFVLHGIYQTFMHACMHAYA